MHSEDIKAALRKKGFSQKEVADRMKVSPTTVHNVICGACKSERVARFISSIVGVDRGDLWPGRYGPRDERLRNAA